MENTIPTGPLAGSFFDVMDEVFENHHGIFLDRNTSLIDTLKKISAAKASQPVGGKCATLAAQVAHVIFYIETNERYMASGVNEDIDWGEIWRTVNAVSTDEWEMLQKQLQDTWRRVSALLKNSKDWEDQKKIDGILAIMVHTAYHLGEIRQALCTFS